MKLELNKNDLRKGVNPEDEHITMTSLNYQAYSMATKAETVVYVSPSGKTRTLKESKNAQTQTTDNHNQVHA